MKRALPKFADRCASTFTNRYNTREAIQSMPTRGRGLIRPRESRTLRRTIKYVHSNTCQCSSRRNCVARYEVGHIKKLSSLPAELAPRSNYMGCILTQRCCQIYPCHRLQHCEACRRCIDGKSGQRGTLAVGLRVAANAPSRVKFSRVHARRETR